MWGSSPRHSPGSDCKGGVPAEPPSLSLAPGPHGEGLEDSPPLGGAGEEDEEEAELEEGRVRGGCSSPPGLRALPQAEGSPKGSGEGASRGAGPLRQRLRARGATPASPQSPSAKPGPLNTARLGGSGGRPEGLRGRGALPAAGLGGSGGSALGLCGVPGWGVQGRESGEGPGAGWEGESSPESSTFSGDEEEKGDEDEVST